MAVKSLAQSSILQPSNTNSMLGDYESNYFHHLETVRLSSNAASVTFSNLAQYSDFQHLQLRIIVRCATSGTAADRVLLRFNNDSGTNYSDHYLRGGTGLSTPASSGQTNRPDIFIGTSPRAGVSAGVYGSSVVDILDPFETTKNKTVKSLTGHYGTDFIVQLCSGAWRSTSAVTSISIVPEDQPFVSGSRFSLYGLKTRS